MLRKAIAVSAVAAALTAGAATAPTAGADVPSEPREPVAGPWLPVFYFGTQTYCLQAGLLGQQTGTLQPGRWTCDSGWLMAQAPGAR